MRNKRKYILVRVFPLRKLVIAEIIIKDKKRNLCFNDELTIEEINSIESYSFPTDIEHQEILWCYIERYIVIEFLKNMDKGE